MIEITHLFSALGDPTRFAIVTKLLRDGAQPAGQLQSVAEMSAPAISRHLKILRDAGLVHQRVAGQSRIYSVVPAAVQVIHGWTMDHETFWAGSLERLEAALEEHDKS
ncbi:MAG: metalloregulator ArsR/SmtB family transcription factor [Pseudoruegeria sp.]